MPANNHLYYFFDHRHPQDDLLLYWPLDPNYAIVIVSQINQIFQDLYATPLRINSWFTVLHHLFHAIDMQQMLPATRDSLRYEINHADLSDAPAIIFRQGSSSQPRPEDAPILCTTIDIAKIKPNSQVTPVLNNSQIEWLHQYFTGKIKVKDHANKQ